jgi:hypothetical protein
VMIRARGVTLRAHWATLRSSLGDAESSLGDVKSSLGDAKSSLGDAESSLGDAESSLGDVIRLFGHKEEDVRLVLYRDTAAWCPYCQKVRRTTRSRSSETTGHLTRCL